MAFQFTPPTYTMPFNGTKKHGDLYRYYDGIITGYSVRIASGVATASPGRTFFSQDEIDAADDGSGVGGKAVFLGGHVYTVTSGEKTILEAAGYTVDTV